MIVIWFKYCCYLHWKITTGFWGYTVMSLNLGLIYWKNSKKIPFFFFCGFDLELVEWRALLGKFWFGWRGFLSVEFKGFWKGSGFGSKLQSYVWFEKIWVKKKIISIHAFQAKISSCDCWLYSLMLTNFQRGHCNIFFMSISKF